MTIRDPSMVYLTLKTRDPVCLGKVPSKERGIYALRDHVGVIHYVGSTKDFLGRITRHVSGSLSRSHKFSHAYNTGRMWADKDDKSPDATLARKLRHAFSRRHCRTTFVLVPPAWDTRELSVLEKAVQALARPEGNHDWGDERNFTPLNEPKELVDALLDELSYSSDQRAAIERQAALCAAFGDTFG